MQAMIYDPHPISHSPFGTLMLGDCLQLLQQLPPESVDMVLVDPPYGLTKNPWDVVIPFDLLWPQLMRVSRDHAAIIVFSSGMFTADLMQSNRRYWRYNLVWQKTSPAGFLNARRQPLRCHEDICVFYRHQPVYHPQKHEGVRKVSSAGHHKRCKMSTNYGSYTPIDYDSTQRYPLSVLVFPKDTRKSAFHATQKPVALLRYLIRTYTDPGSIILDCCCGSGSTGVAALQEGRRYVLERDEHIFDKALSRLYETMESMTITNP